MPRKPLPPQLLDGSFHIAKARALEISLGRLRGPDFEQPHYGLRTTAPPELKDYAPLLRTGERFSHTTAALLWPLDLPRLPAGVHVTIATPDGDPRNPARGQTVIGHRSLRDDSVMRNGLRLSDPIALFVELATILRSDDLVAVGDALVLDPAELDPYDIRPWITLTELRRGCSESRRPGCRRARQAADQVREGAESRTETLLRLLIIGAGLPEPELGLEVLDRRGRVIGRFDMIYAAAKVIVEYDGEQHRTKDAQYDKDQVRIARAIAAGWRVVRVRWRGLFQRPDETIAEVREALGA